VESDAFTDGPTLTSSPRTKTLTAPIGLDTFVAVTVALPVGIPQNRLGTNRSLSAGKYERMPACNRDRQPPKPGGNPRASSCAVPAPHTCTRTRTRKRTQARTLCVGARARYTPRFSVRHIIRILRLGRKGNRCNVCTCRYFAHNVPINRTWQAVFGRRIVRAETWTVSQHCGSQAVERRP
jgi:hypothetical protein